MAQMVSTFVAIALCVLTGTFGGSGIFDTFLLAAPWCAWLLFSLLTLKTGFDTGWIASTAANCISVATILLTYTQFVRTHKTAVAVVVLVCMASILFFPQTSTNAFQITTRNMALHVSVFVVAYIFSGYFDKLMGERIYSCGDLNNQIVRALRVAWLLFVENELLFFLVPQMFAIILYLNYHITTTRIINDGCTRVPPTVIVSRAEEILCKSSQQPAISTPIQQPRQQVFFASAFETRNDQDGFCPDRTGSEKSAFGYDRQMRGCAAITMPRPEGAPEVARGTRPICMPR